MKATSLSLTSAMYQALVKAERFNFYDEFNRTGEDTDVWTTGDTGSFADQAGNSLPTMWRLLTGALLDNDRFIHGDAVIKNFRFTPDEEDYDTVTFETRLSISSAADVSAFLGLIFQVITDYTEPAAICAHFLVDPAISATFRARSHMAAEEETDTLIALDTALHKFKIVWTITSVEFYIDDVLVATHAAQVPRAPMTPEILVRTEAVATKSIDIDYVRVTVS